MAEAFAVFIARHGHFFRTKTRNSAAVAGRYLRGLALRRRLAIDVGALVMQSRILEALRLCRQDNQAKRPCAASGDVQRAKP